MKPFATISIVLVLLSVQALLGGLISSTPSMSEYATGAEELVVYTDVPGHATQAPMLTVKPGINPQNEIPLKLKSDIFTIRVKSAATDDQWVQCFTHYTYNRGSEIEDIDKTDGTNSPVVIQNYQNLTSGWSHSYANIEMTPNSPVEVEIALIGATQLNGKNFIEKFAVHPFDKAANSRLEAGKIYFTIDKPCQVVIDINGQMDDHNAAVNPMAGNPPAHGISLFANPILAKPAATGPAIVSMAPGDAAPDPSTFDTLVFQPGVHEIGLSFPLHPGKSYYIPGDAVLIGTFSNLLSSKGSYRTKGDSIRMYGYGTISGATYTHYLYPGHIQGPTNFSDRAIVIEEGVSCELFGLTITDPANHSTRFFSWSGSDQASDKSYARWMKPITWRANGDGIGGAIDLEDCFLRTADDSTYANANRRRCTFWKDVNAAICHMPDIPRGTAYFEDCDVIYNRLRDPIGNNGGGFQLREGSKGVIQGDMVIRNIRFLDKRSNMSAINFNNPDTSFKGVRFENVSIEPPVNGRKQKMFGSGTAPWFGGVTFKNVSFGGVPLTELNFDTYFDRNEWVNYLLFDDPLAFTLTTLGNAAEGEVRRDLTQATYTEMTPVVLSAVANYGDFVFSHWSGGASGSENPLTVWMTENKTITANFRPATIHEQVVIQFPASGTWTVPAGVYSLTIDTWGAGGAGGSAHNGATSAANTQARGGGGAGGSFSSKTLLVNPGQVITYAVGAGGLAAGAGFVHLTDAGSGGTSSASVNGESTTAVGGPGGKNISVSNQNLAGTGGTAPATGNSGDVIHYGGNGGSSSSGGTGGGGGSAGSLGAGGHGSVVTPGVAGPGGGATGGTGHNDTNEGKSGGNPGAGGSGAGVRSSANNHRTGGNGADGHMIVTYNILPINFTLTTESENGSIVLDPPGGSYLAGSTVGVEAVPMPGFLFTGWSGALSGTDNPTSVLMDGNQSITANFQIVETFELPGTGSWTVPPGVNHITVRAWGGGGAGGSAFSGTATSNTQARAGGGAGGSFAHASMSVTPGQVISYHIGAGGLGAASGFAHLSEGAAGEASFAELNGVSFVSAQGGPGGRNISVTNALVTGTGGQAPQTGNVGDVAFYGGNGAGANSNGTGGGGGSAGSLGNGENAPSPFTGSNAPGGAAGPGGGAIGGNGHNSTAVGNAGGAPGAGGSGAAVRNNSPFSANNFHRTGGSGGNGKIVVAYHTQAVTFNLSTNVLNGSIALNPPGGVYNSGQVVTLTANPASGYTFGSWSGDLDGFVNPISLTMDGSKSVTVNFNSAVEEPFTTWAGAGVNFDEDANNDGVDNGLAWFLGAEHPDDPSAELLPKPTGNAGALVLEFDCLHGADRGTAVFEVQYKSELGQIDAWSGTVIPGETGTFTDGVVDFVVTDAESVGGLLRVVATIPAGEAADGTLFGRIRGIK